MELAMTQDTRTPVASWLATIGSVVPLWDYATADMLSRDCLEQVVWGDVR